jgi:O-antigen/teichoic acid export membrane protein
MSLAVGVVVGGRRVPVAEAPSNLRREEIRRSGRWLVSLALLDAASVFAVAALVAQIAGPSALGYAEAARIAAHPVMVLAWGLSAVLGPGSVRAARERQADVARKIGRRFAGILAAAGVLSLLLLSTNWWGNPMARLLPTAYVMPGLAGLSIVAYLANGLGLPLWSELLGGRKERKIAEAELKGSLVRLVLAGTAVLTRAYAVPLSLLGFGLTRWVAFHRVRHLAYAPEPPYAPEPRSEFSR